MKELRRWPVVAVFLLLVALVGCEAVNEDATGELAKEPQAIETSAAYTPTQPLRASYGGSTIGAPTWHRVNTDGSLNSWATAVPYHAQAFQVSGVGSYEIHNQYDFDGYLLLFGGSFDPTNASPTLITGNDDYYGTLESLISVTLVPDTTYYVVTTGYGNWCAGAFTTSIYGPYAVTLGEANPVEATNALITDVEQLVEDGVLKTGQANGLIRPLENALRSLDRERPEDACNQLADFIMEVEAKVPPLTEAQASELIASAEAILDMLECE